MTTNNINDFDAIVVGAGFGGMYMVHVLGKLGLNVRGYERGGDVGGTWYWNRYPGCQCDVESMEYSYQFSEDLQQEWEWTNRYASQEEILDYAAHVADRFNLREKFRFNAGVTSATWGDDDQRWRIETENGDTVTAQYFIMATGCLSTANIPAFPGLDDFRGQTYHTGGWPHEGVDFTGQKVAVIGTGSSGVQSIPLIARQAADLTVFQRTPNYSIPTRTGRSTQNFNKTSKPNILISAPGVICNQPLLAPTIRAIQIPCSMPRLPSAKRGSRNIGSSGGLCFSAPSVIYP